MTHAAAPPTGVLVVDDQELFRTGLCAKLEEAGFLIFGEYPSATAALEAVGKRWEPEPGMVVFCSLTMGGWQQLVHQLLLLVPRCPILGVADTVTDQLALEALSNGVLRCMGRALPPEEWVKSVREIHTSKASPVSMVLRHPAIARQALTALSQPPGPAGLQPLAPVLGHRERMALAELAEEVPLNVIGEQMGVPQEAVHEALESACQKLVARQRLARILAQIR